MATTDGFRHRPEIDGLRAAAILDVVLFHAGLGCAGGFVGVDVFFVISGYLITSLVWRDLGRGTFSPADFWERRARRLLPALLCVVFATLAAGGLLMLPGDLAGLGRAAAAQAVFGANVHAWADAGYFAGPSHEKPLLHMWSLAVEEQFYLVWPVLLWGASRSAALRRRPAVLALTGILLAASFAASVYGVAHDRDAAFYLLPARAWELLAGAVVAFLPPPGAFWGRRGSREALAWFGLAAMAAPVFAYHPKTPFPGVAALPPCLGAAAFLWATTGGWTGAAAVMSVRPAVFVGRISYSLYLWHWPLFAFANYTALEPPSAGRRVALLAASFVLAALSWRFVEEPWRRAVGRRRSTLRLAAAALAVALGCGLACAAARGFPGRLPSDAQRIADARHDGCFGDELTLKDVEAGRLRRIGAADPDLLPAVLLWGDSHAASAVPAVDAFLAERGLVGLAATHSATAPVLDWYLLIGQGLGPEAVAYNEAVLAVVRDRRIPAVLLVARWEGYLEFAGTDEACPVPLGRALVATVRRIAAAGAEPWVMLNVPNHTFNIPRALSQPLYSKPYVESLCAKPAVVNELEAAEPGVTAELQAAGAKILDPKPRFLDPEGRRYVVEANGIPLYCDKHHLTKDGARMMLLPFFREALTLPNLPRQGY